MSSNVGKTSYDDNTGIAQLSSGMVLRNFHNSNKCFTQHCPVHHPREHEYSGYPLGWVAGSFVRFISSDDAGIVIDPDDYNYNQGRAIIIRNSARCDVCGDEIVSTYHHDYKSCSCGNLSVDGGHSYLKRTFSNKGTFTDTSISFKKEIEESEIEEL